MQWCHVNFSPEDPCCHGNQPFLRQNWLQGHKSLKRQNAAARLYSVAMAHVCVVPQNVFLVFHKRFLTFCPSLFPSIYCIVKSCSGGRPPIDRVHLKTGENFARKCSFCIKISKNFWGPHTPPSTFPPITNFWIRH